MKSIFNSLGSNYDFNFVVKALFSFDLGNSRLKLQTFLNKKYGGKTILLYKGREAIKLALDALSLPKNSLVGINGFTCYAVYKAVVDAGCQPVLLDIAGKNLNFSVDELKTNGKDLKALIVQNTLGNPCDISGIKKYCDKNKIFLIEDLAHSVGSIYQNGKETGTVGDFVALSFSQDKIVDSLSGGALVIRNKIYQNFRPEGYQKLNLIATLKDRFYPLWTYLIRVFYPLGAGKALHFVLRKLKMLPLPIADKVDIKPHSLPSWYSKLAFDGLGSHKTNVDHRRLISGIYAANLDRSVISDDFIKNISLSANVRFPVFVKDRSGLVNYLKSNGIYISDIWYDAPIAPKKFLESTHYIVGQCPVSEEVSSEILNLPTHVNVSESDALYISETINKWLNLK